MISYKVTVVTSLTSRTYPVIVTRFSLSTGKKERVSLSLTSLN